MRLLFTACALAACNGTDDPITDPTDDPAPTVVTGSDLLDDATRIDALFEDLDEQHGTPALAGAVIDSDGIFAVGVTGVRVQGGGDLATIKDRWHLGSLTKAMTGTLAAILVDEGVITYDTTVDQVWPDADPSWSGATLEQLLTHRSGATGSIGADHGDLWTAAFAERDGKTGRNALVAALIDRPQDGVRGQFLYSNAGFIIAGAMLEERTGEPWQALMQEHLFEPYGMDQCGFGPPQGDEPWGHSRSAGSPTDPSTVGADNPPALGPAGTVHCSLASWGQFVALHLRGANGTEPTLDQAVFARMHTPDGDYAHGWGVGQRPWAGGTTLSHRGSNTMWIADMWVAPGIDRAFLAVSNSGFGTSGTAVDSAVVALIQADLQRDE